MYRFVAKRRILFNSLRLRERGGIELRIVLNQREIDYDHGSLGLLAFDSGHGTQEPGVAAECLAGQIVLREPLCYRSRTPNRERSTEPIGRAATFLPCAARFAVMTDVGKCLLCNAENGNFQRGRQPSKVGVVDELDVWNFRTRLVNQVLQCSGNALFV